jgi:hypothetical protein
MYKAMASSKTQLMKIHLFEKPDIALIGTKDARLLYEQYGYGLLHNKVAGLVAPLIC